MKTIKSLIAFIIITYVIVQFNQIEDTPPTTTKVEVKDSNSGGIKTKIYYTNNNIYDSDISHTLTTVEVELFKLVNNYRIKNGLSVMRWGDKLHKMARRHSYYQSQIGDWSHKEDVDIPNFKEESRLSYRALTFGYNHSNVLEIGENTSAFRKRATPYQTAKAKFEGWKNSKAHNELMLSKLYTIGGCGCKESNIRYGDVKDKEYVFCTLNMVAEK